MPLRKRKRNDNEDRVESQYVYVDVLRPLSAAMIDLGPTNLTTNLSASQAVVTDGSKNLASLQYTSSSTASTIVSRDSNGAVQVQSYKPINIKTNLDYTLVASDAGKCIVMFSNSAHTLTIPTSGTVSFPIGTEIEIIQFGSGAVSFAVGGLTVDSVPGGIPAILGQFSKVKIFLEAVDTWVFSGDLRQSGTLISPNSAVTDNYTLQANDSNTYIQVNVSLAKTITVPNEGSVAWLTGTTITLIQIGSHSFSLVGGSGVAFSGNGSLVSSPYNPLVLRRTGANAWNVEGISDVLNLVTVSSSALTASTLVATDVSKNLTSAVTGLSPTFTGLNLSGLTASTLVATDASKNISSSVSGLSPTFTGLNLSGLTASTLTATDGSKNLTSSVTGLSPTFTGLNLSGLTASTLAATDGSKNLTSAVTGLSPTFTGLNLSGLTASGLVATDGSKNLSSTVSGLSPTMTGLNLSGLTASTLVATDASKNISSSVTGLSPTFTGLTVSGLTASKVVFTNGSSALTTSLITDAEVSGSAAITGTKIVSADGTTTGVLTSTSQIIGGLKTFNAGLVAKYNTISVASTVQLGGALAVANAHSQININSAASAITATLPAATNGCHWIIFINSSTLANTVTISAASAILFGSLMSSDGTAVTGGAITAAKTNLIIGTTAKIGDRYLIDSDGVSWYVTGFTSAHGSVSVS
jgi:hypothetical protein